MLSSDPPANVVRDLMSPVERSLHSHEYGFKPGIAQMKQKANKVTLITLAWWLECMNVMKSNTL